MLRIWIFFVSMSFFRKETSEKIVLFGVWSKIFSTGVSKTAFSVSRGDFRAKKFLLEKIYLVFSPHFLQNEHDRCSLDQCFCVGTNILWYSFLKSLELLNDSAPLLTNLLYDILKLNSYPSPEFLPEFFFSKANLTIVFLSSFVRKKSSCFSSIWFLRLHMNIFCCFVMEKNFNSISIGTFWLFFWPRTRNFKADVS